MRDLDDIIMYKAFVEKFRVHIFLNGLDVEFEQVLSMDLTLNLEGTHLYVHHEANHQTLLSSVVFSSNLWSC